MSQRTTARASLEHASLLLLLVALTEESRAEATDQTRQDGSDASDIEFRAEAPERPKDMPLAELPVPPSRQHPSPRPEAVEAVERLLSQIVGEDELVREQASRMLLEARADWISPIARKLSRLRESSKPKAQKSLLGKMREATKTRIKQETGKRGDTPDYLLVALEHPDAGSKNWQDLTQLLALNRMLSAIGTTGATREIIRVYQRFGEYMRIDCQRQLEAMGDLATAGLIEAQRSQATKVTAWANRLLRLSGKDQPGQAVRTENDQALAEILVALGRQQDPDSAPLLISFASTERAQIRRAARQGLALMGGVSSWQLKDAYLNTTGKQPPRDWTWKRTARELFTEFDRLRLAQVWALYEKAEAARKADDLERMAASYDELLALDPSFDRKSSMAEGYILYAQTIRESAPNKAILALRRAERLSPSDDLKRKSRGKRLLLEAEALERRGIIDHSLIESAQKLNPGEAKEGQALLTPSSPKRPWGRSSRYLIAGVTAAIALLGAAWVLFTGFLKRNRGGNLAAQNEEGATNTAAPSQE